jgi:hypothetical protein
LLGSGLGLPAFTWTTQIRGMRASRLLAVTFIFALVVLVANIAYAMAPAKDASFADQPLSTFQPSVANDRGIRAGSFGSGLFRDRTDPPHVFYMVTDRGPNGQPNDLRTFPVPDFDPTIVKVRVRGERVQVLEQIPLTTTSGPPVTGLPNFSAVTSPLSSTPPAPDEVPYNFDASEPLNLYYQNGLDTEDIVRTSTGEFWLVEEYRRSLLHVAANDTVLARYVPIGVGDEFTDVDYPVYETLPARFAYRRVNRGFEGLAIAPDGSSLFVALQSPLQLPPSTTVGRDSRNIRILRLDLSGNVTGEIVYRFDVVSTFDPASGARARDMKVSGLYAISATRLLVLERTDFVAKVYLVDLTAATDVATWTSPSPDLNYVERLNADGALELAGITPLPKTLVVDLDTIDGMPDKIESITLVNPGVLAVANDNDFGLTDDPTWDAEGRLTSDTGAASRILYVALP